VLISCAAWQRRALINFPWHLWDQRTVDGSFMQRLFLCMWWGIKELNSQAFSDSTCLEYIAWYLNILSYFVIEWSSLFGLINTGTLRKRGYLSCLFYKIYWVRISAHETEILKEFSISTSRKVSQYFPWPHSKVFSIRCSYNYQSLVACALLIFHWRWSLNSNYCPGQKYLKFKINFNAFKVCTVNWGRHWKFKLLEDYMWK
jgi:hypothetical protein